MEQYLQIEGYSWRDRLLILRRLRGGLLVQEIGKKGKPIDSHT